MKRITAVAVAALAAITLTDGAARAFFNSPGEPPHRPPMDCAIVVSWNHASPAAPMTSLPGGKCEANAEVALAVVLTTLLQADAATPVPK